jgi:outer membrane lipoprotein-sorting protein
MRRSALLFPIFAALTLLRGVAQTPQPEAADPLRPVLSRMDTAAANFRTTQADFEWDRYEKVIDEVDDVQRGTIYYRRVGKEIEMKADVKMAGSSRDQLKPEPKLVLFKEGKIQMYLPKPNQLTIYDAGKNRAEVESYLVLGFGGTGQDLVKSFDLTYLGQETVNNTATAKLQLVPKSQKVRNTFAKILLWIDLERGISVQQQFFEPDGNYRLAKYSGLRVNEKIAGEVFEIKTKPGVQTVSR